MKERTKVIGPEHESTLGSISTMGWAFDSYGKYEEAKVMY
jgi:hypothetical protein